MKSAPFSVDSILRSTVMRLAIFGVLAVVVVFMSQFAVLSYQSHRAVCEIVAARFNQYAGPLSRELALADNEIAANIFDEFKQVIATSGAKPDLELKINQLGPNKNIPACTSSVLGASVHQQVTFAGKQLAVIEGRVTYFPMVSLILFVLGVVIALILSIRKWTIGLVERIQQLLIFPIKELSIGNDIDENKELPIEVQDVSKNIKNLKMKLIEEEKIVALLERDQHMSDMAIQVAHDIRSPLSVLALLDYDGFKFDNENRALLIAASKRIQNIAQSLTQKYQVENSQVGHEGDELSLISVTIDAIVSEKRPVANFEEVTISVVIDPPAQNSFARVSSVELGRAISNMIDNAIEAFDNPAKRAKEIGVRLSAEGNHLVIAISDNGPGIDPLLLPKLCQRGSSTKARGLGLGLFHAKTFCEFAGGRFDIESNLGAGTTISLTLPLTQTPPWFCEKLEIPEGRKLILIDDDEAIHRFWIMKLGEKSMTRFYSGEDVALKEVASDPECLFLVDFQLGAGRTNGLDLISSMNIADRSILVTSRFDDTDIHKRAMDLKIKILPKQLLGRIEIHTQSDFLAKENHDLVLIDDDELIRGMWELRARDANLKIALFEDGIQFLAAKIPKTTPIFIDQNLADDILGQDVAIQLKDHGYQRIYLASADATLKNVPDFILSVRGKEFPDRSVLVWP